MLHWRCLLSLALLGLAGAGARAADRPAFFTLLEVGKGVWAAIALPGGHAGANSGFVVGDDSVLVVDSFADPAAAQALLDAIHEKTPLPVRYVVNTHYHLDHVAGNVVYRSAGAVIMAQRNVRGWERSENLKFFGDKITAAQETTVQSYVLPEVVYRDGMELYLGNRKIVVRVMPGHTGGDSIVHVPDADAVFTGDLFWNHSLPNLIDADTRAQIDTNTSFVASYPTANFVPGHGEVGRAADVGAFRDYLVALRHAVASARDKSEPEPMLQQDVLKQLQGTYGKWNYFDHFAEKNIAQTAAELAGAKHRPEEAGGGG